MVQGRRFAAALGPGARAGRYGLGGFMPIGIALGIAGAGLIGDVIASQGQQSTNVANAQQAQNQMQFQQSIFNQQTQLANTAMQRRVADLKAAGLNPWVAAGGQGAAIPGSQSGAMATFQNPEASFSNAGQIASAAAQGSTVASQVSVNTANAQQAAAQAGLANAQAAKLAGVDTAAQQQNIKESQTKQELMKAQSDAAAAGAALDRAQVQVAQAQLPKIQAEITNLAAQTDLAGATAALRDLDSSMQGLSIAQFKLISPSLVESAANAAARSGAELQPLLKQAAAAQTKFGTVTPYLDTIFNWFHLGANITSHQ